MRSILVQYAHRERDRACVCCGHTHTEKEIGYVRCGHTHTIEHEFWLTRNSAPQRAPHRNGLRTIVHGVCAERVVRLERHKRVNAVGLASLNHKVKIVRSDWIDLPKLSLELRVAER
jgi:hypothetical protein